MPKDQLLVVLVGESGSGKSTIADRLNAEGITEVTSHTEREPRLRELFLTRAPYMFSNREEYERQHLAGEVFEETEIKGVRYWTRKEDFVFTGVRVLVCDVTGIASLKSRAADLPIVVIHISSDEQCRRSRLMTDYWWNQPKSREFYHREHAENAVDARISRDYGRFDLIPCDYVIKNNEKIEKAMSLIHQIIAIELGRA